MRNLPAILTEGILPARTICGHTCLTSDPAMALFYARLGQSFGGGEGSQPVLIRIGGGNLDPRHCVAETGSIEIGAYGRDMKGRNQFDLRALGGGWRRILRASDALGYSGIIEVGEGMLDLRPANLPMLEYEIMAQEMKRGYPVQVETVRLIDSILSLSEPLAMAA